MRTIDADAFSEHYGNYYAEQGSAEGFIGTVDDLIAKQPTIEVEPVIHAHWVNDTWCSNCNRFPVKQGTGYDNQKLTKYFEYCPHCGFKMDKIPNV